MAIQPMVTDSMRAYARVLLSKSPKWARGVDHEKGVAFVMFTSSRVDKDGKPIYHKTRCDGAFCNCPGFYHRGVCSHALACRWEAEQAREDFARPTVYESLYGNVDAF
jgi:hypothetical protein